MTKVLKGAGVATVALGPATVPARPAGVLAAPVYDAERDARAVREEAERLAAEIVARAGAEADRIRGDAKRQGREEGLAEATGLLARTHAERARLLTEAEPELRTLAVAIAEKVLSRSLQGAPELAVSVCAAALEHSRAAASIVIEVNPADVPIVEAARAELEAKVGRRDSFVVRASEAITRGGCIVESSLGRVDARLETQLASIRAALGVR